MTGVINQLQPFGAEKRKEIAMKEMHNKEGEIYKETKWMFLFSHSNGAALSPIMKSEKCEKPILLLSMWCDFSHFLTHNPLHGVYMSKRVKAKVQL